MKYRIIALLALLLMSTPILAQHSAQVDDGAGHYSLLVGPNPGGTFTLPAGGGTLLVSSAPSISSAWLLGGNLSSAANNQIGTLDATDFNIVTGGLANVRLAVSGTTGGVSIPSLTATDVIFAGAGGLLSQDAGNFVWDATNHGLGLGTVPTLGNVLTLSGNLSMTNATDKVTNPSTELIMEETGDTYGTSRLRLQDRVGSNGALFEQIPNAGHLGIDLVDFGFKPGAGVQSDLRLEARSTSLSNPANSNGEFQLLDDATGAYKFTLTVGRNTASFFTNLGIGAAVPTQALEVKDGNILLSNTGTAGELRLAEPFAGGSEYTSFKAQAQSANIAYTLPATLPTVGQYLVAVTSGAGAATLAWGTVGPKYEAAGSYSFTVPANASAIMVEATGAGGGGGGGNFGGFGGGAAAGTGGGGGAGAGEYISTNAISVTAGHVLQITVGAGGTAGAGGGGVSDGGAGGNTTIYDVTSATTLLTANGGTGGLKSAAGSNGAAGNGGNGGTGSSNTGHVDGNGGTGGSGNVGNTGGAGGAGAVGPSNYGAGGDGGKGGNKNGFTGGSAGTKGSDGSVIISFTY